MVAQWARVDREKKKELRLILYFWVIYVDCIFIRHVKGEETTSGAGFGLRPLVTLEGSLEEKSPTYEPLTMRPQKLDIQAISTGNTYFLDFQ